MATPSDPDRAALWDGAWERALELAGRGLGRVSPNPPVGAVLLRGGRVIGEGWHREYGGPHAEREAIADAESRGEEVAGSTMLVTLEPCAHTGRQPPCADLLVEKGIGEVVYGCEDPSVKTHGKGPEILRRSGVRVSIATEDVAARARHLTRGFRKHCATGRPLVVLKMAMSLDGRVAGPSGEQVHLTCPETDALVHRWRSEFDSIAIGSGTLASDDPRLTARGVPGAAQPTRVVFLGSNAAGRAATGDEALFGDLPEAPLVFVLDGRTPGDEPDRDPAARLSEMGAGVVYAGSGSAVERFGEALSGLGALGIRTVLLEGGPTLAASGMVSGEVDEIELFLAPVVLGEGPGALDRLSGAPDGVLDPLDTAVSVSGGDIRLSLVLREW